MNDSGIEKNLHQTALICGFDNCGIIPLEHLDGFKKRYQERVRKVPSSAVFYKVLGNLAETKKRFPWAKSIVICTYWYFKEIASYLVPEQFRKLSGDYLIKNVIPKTADHMPPSHISALRKNAERALRFHEKQKKEPLKQKVVKI